MSGFPVHHQLQKLTQTHVQVGDAIQPSHPAVPFSSCLQSFPASGSFQMSHFFASGGQNMNKKQQKEYTFISGNLQLQYFRTDIV